MKENTIIKLFRFQLALIDIRNHCTRIQSDKTFEAE
jgi:hypothetical protein